jgi:hypothetical protein
VSHARAAQSTALLPFQQLPCAQQARRRAWVWRINFAAAQSVPRLFLAPLRHLADARGHNAFTILTAELVALARATGAAPADRVHALRLEAAFRTVAPVAA